MDEQGEGAFCALRAPKRSDDEVLTPFEYSRCYHSRMDSKDEWFQLFDHSDWWQFEWKAGTGYGTWPDPDNRIL